MATVARRTVSRSAPAARESSGYSGNDVMRKVQEEEQKQKARKEAAQMSFGMPFRFFCLPNGETKEIVVVDDQPNFVRHEHALQNTRTGKYDVFTACIDEHANCPVCKVAQREAYFAMYLTIIDLTPYTNKDGIEVPWSKKLLVIKTMQQKKITRLLQQHGTLRGMVLAMTRDGEKEAAIGSDIQFVEFLDEDTLATYVTDYEYEKDGKKVVKEIVGGEPFDYDEMFPMPTEQQLRAIVGGRPEPGSRDDDQGSERRPRRGGDDWEGSPAPRAATRQAARPAARAPVRTREIAPEDNPEAGVEEEYVEEAAPRAPVRRGAPQQPQRAAARPPTRRAPEPEPEAEEEYVEEEPAAPPPRRAAPPQRTAAPAPRAPAARAPAGRAAPTRTPQPDPEYDEEPPQRSAASLAARRQALRRP